MHGPSFCKYERIIIYSYICLKEKYKNIELDHHLKVALRELALEEVRKQIDVGHILVDAMPLPDLDIPHTPIIKGDAKSISIAAASVIAKVTRDREMYELDNKYPDYGFKSHKGYPTKKHIEAINIYGLIDGYRKSYGPVKAVIGGIK